MTPIAQAADVQQHVLQLGQVRFVRHDKAVALARIEPFHRAGDQDSLRRFNLAVIRQLTTPGCNTRSRYD
ncbi:hypothetical protein D3C86_2217670 [compost metagenome]